MYEPTDVQFDLHFRCGHEHIPQTFLLQVDFESVLVKGI